MASNAIKGKDLRKMGYPEGKVIKVAMQVLERHFRGRSRTQKLQIMQLVIANQDEYLGDPRFRLLVRELQQKLRVTTEWQPGTKAPYEVFGLPGIQGNTIHQMENALKLPVAVQGALMPDAHFGYGLPIGGVLATENAVIPYGVGLDIGCRMSLSVLDMPVEWLNEKRASLRQTLIDNTCFGQEAFQRPGHSAVLDRSEFKEVKAISRLKDLAWQQLGSSGSGNHFVEFGEVELAGDDSVHGLQGRFAAILTHSGSRGLGANLARYYTKIARLTCQLPENLRHLAWLDLDSEAGQEYWVAMNLAGDYAKACHDDIHRRLLQQTGAQRLINIENHHNFAWKEQLADGTEVIVHRKGATPAGEGVLGIIPGSMTTSGFIVKGRGNPDSLNSASHGAGRELSRSEARDYVSQADLDAELHHAGVDLVGGSVDESPHAYKDIHQVIGYQHDLVEVIGTFFPRIVRMAGKAE